MNDLTCEKYDERFSTKSNLKAHAARHQDQNFNCDICEKSHSTKGGLTYHVSQKHNEDGQPLPEVPCGECNKEFSGVASLRTHTSRFHREIGHAELKEKLRQLQKKLTSK